MRSPGLKPINASSTAFAPAQEVFCSKSRLSAFYSSGDKLVMKPEANSQLPSAAREVNLGNRNSLRACACLAVVVSAFALAASGAPVLVSPQGPTTNRVSLGSKVVLTVEATSPSSEILYQWALGTNDLLAATNATLSIDKVTTNQTGVYTVRATDADGTATSPGMTVLIGATFTKITTEPFSSGGGAQGISWGDVNGDGWMDVYCSARSSANTTLFTNNGHGSFARAGQTVGANLVNPIGGAFGDYDNNGTLDFYIALNNGGNDILLRNMGTGVFSSVTSGSIVSSGGNSNGSAWGDYDNDGFIDLYVANSDGNNFLFHNNKDGSFTRITTGPMLNGTGGSQGVAWVDYDADGFPDLFVTRGGAPNLLVHNQGNGTFALVTNGPIITQTSGGSGFSWGDYDNDGLPDLFAAGGGNVLYHNNGGGNFTRTNSPTGTDSFSCFTAHWMDYDNDGWLDLFLTSFTTGTACRLYHNNGDGTFTRVEGSALVSEPGRWFAAAWADMNNDGFPDVLVSNVNNPNVLHRKRQRQPLAAGALPGPDIQSLRDRRESPNACDHFRQDFLAIP
ncbi:MAG: hypothetical protein JWM16_3676 [Verrucomicrobiales bacterium]|nr:hypothetical protein [Verrucomicrobiales bacterium]